MSLTYGSVCSGIEAASVAWHQLGWTAAWLAEIEAAPAALLAYRYPRVMNLGDMTKIAALVRCRAVAAPDILVGGTPCQAFSVAGMRAGLLDPRGQLTLAYCDLLDAIDEQRPGDEAIFYWENVPGVLSDKTNALGCFLGLLAGEECALLPPGRKWPNAGYVIGPKRAIAWRILDAQYFGVAQRRRRVFVVGSARKGFDPAKLLFESEGVRRDSPPSREARQEIAGAVTASAGRRGGVDDPERGKLQVVAGTLSSRTSGGGGLGTDFELAGGLQAVAGTLLSHGHSANPLDETLVTCMAHGQGGAEVSVGDRPTLTCNHEAPIIAFNSNALADEMRFDPHAAAALTCSQSSAVCVTGDITHCLKAEGFDASEDGTGRGQPIVAVAENERGEVRISEVMGALSVGGGKPGQGYPAVLTKARVRRLTPRECERLQGFPDDWTLVPLPLKKRQTRVRYMADGPRYKALGNSMAVPCMLWLGRRLILTHPLILAKIAK